mmetsp:Transcript_14852/g.31492  ORF Transcript_14852/g.31492 Transcript_14852/m.31492 type:complete len:466 (+) Transcript_14852:484-1881(+)
MVVHHDGACLRLLLAQHLHALKEGDVLRLGELAHGLDARVEAQQAALLRLHWPLVRVVVAVEDDLPVLVKSLSRDINRLGALLDGVGHLGEGVGEDGAKHGVHHGDVLRRADRAELEAVAPVREGRGAVAVLGGRLEGRDGVDAELARGVRRHVLDRRLGLLEGLEVLGDVIAEVGGHDGGRCLAGTEAKVVARRRDGHAHEVAVLVDGPDDGGHEDGEDLGLAALLVDGGGVEQVNARVGAEREVVVLAAAVDALEGLLGQQADKVVLVGNLLHKLHDHEVLVDLRSGEAKEGCALILVGRDLTVARLERDAHLEALVLHLLHAAQCGGVERRHVVVAELLPARRVAAHDGATCQLQVRPLLECGLRDEEEFLLEADVRENRLALVAEQLKETHACLRNGLHRAQQRRLLVERLAIIRDKDRRHEERVAADPHRRRRVEHRVAACSMCRPHTTVHIRRAISLAL